MLSTFSISKNFCFSQDAPFRSTECRNTFQFFLIYYKLHMTFSNEELWSIVKNLFAYKGPFKGISAKFWISNSVYVYKQTNYNNLY